MDVPLRMKTERTLARASHYALRSGYQANRILHHLGLARLAPVRALKERVKGVLFQASSPHKPCVLTKLECGTMLVPWNFIHHYFFAEFEPLTVTLFRESLRPGSVVLDIGAHIGYYSVLAAQAVGSEGRVFAFEPGPDNFEILERNIAINAFRNVQPFRQAVSNKGGLRPFVLSEPSDRQGFYPHPFASTVQTCLVECVTVDSFLGNRPVDVVKIDVEGGEISVLEGMQQTLARNPKIVLFLELNPPCLRAAGHTAADLLRVLRDAGFSISLIDESSRRLEPVASYVLHPSEDVPWCANLYCVRA